jgi:hypothetical protein
MDSHQTTTKIRKRARDEFATANRRKVLESIHSILNRISRYLSHDLDEAERSTVQIDWENIVQLLEDFKANDNYFLYTDAPELLTKFESLGAPDEVKKAFLKRIEPQYYDEIVQLLVKKIARSTTNVGERKQIGERVSKFATKGGKKKKRRHKSRKSRKRTRKRTRRARRTRKRTRRARRTRRTHLSA